MSNEKEKKIGPVLPSRFNAAEFHRNLYHARAEKGTTIADVEDSEYWVHVCATLNKFDRIEVIEESGAWWVELIVLSANKKDSSENTQERPTIRVRVALLHSKTFTKLTEEKLDEDATHYEVKFSEGNSWHVLRKRDAHIAAKDMDTEEEAVEWIDKNIGSNAQKKAA